MRITLTLLVALSVATPALANGCRTPESGKQWDGQCHKVDHKGQNAIERWIATLLGPLTGPQTAR